MSRSRRAHNKHRRVREHREGHSRFMLLAFNAAGRPLTVHDLRHQFIRLGYHFSMPAAVIALDQADLPDKDIEAELESLRAEGLLSRAEDGAYALTDAGAAMAADMESRMGRALARVRRFVSDSRIACIVSLCVNAVLAAAKLSTGFVFGSVALIADGLDSSVDVASATVVYFGIRFQREVASTLFIIAGMSLTSLFIVRESVLKLVQGTAVEPSLLAFITAVGSGAVCYAMSVYQDFVGKRSSSLSLLSQSVDSRNHVYQAGAVIVGLVFALFRVYVVDALVGLVVAGLMLRSAIELTIEVTKARKGGELDTSHFERGYERAWSQHQLRQFECWLLSLLNEAHAREDILVHYKDVYSTDDLPVVKHFSPASAFNLPARLDKMLASLQERRLIAADGGLYRTTTDGQSLLGKSVRHWRFFSA
jgi:Co/Zn/Cd efflux system component